MKKLPFIIPIERLVRNPLLILIRTFIIYVAGHVHSEDWDAVIKDCTSALSLDKAYVKALTRRANAFERKGGLDNLFESLCGTSISFLIINLEFNFVGIDE